MTMSDPIADMFTRIRNAQSAKKNWVDMPSSNTKKRICYILKEEHFIRDYVLVEKKVVNTNQFFIRIFLKYDSNNDSVINGLKRISKPGCRVYTTSKKLPRVFNGMGVAIVTTSKGIVSSKKAKQFNVGGEILCHIW